MSANLVVVLLVLAVVIVVLSIVERRLARLDRVDRSAQIVKEGNVLDWLAHTPYALWVDKSWGWPIALTIHAYGNGAVVGLMAIIGLRLYGLFRSIPYTACSSCFPTSGSRSCSRSSAVSRCG